MESITKVFSDIVKPYIDKSASTSGDPKTVSYANIVSIKDGAGVLAKDVSIKIEPVQAGSGTPSPSNVRAISGWSSAKVTRAGKNLVDLSVTESGGIDANGNYVDSQGGTLWRMKQNAFINVQPNEKYSCRWTAIEQKPLLTFRIYYYDKDKNYLYRQDFNTGSVFTIPSNAYFIKWTTYTVEGQVTQDIVESYQIQIEIGEQATSYEPYAGNDYTIQLGDTYYGGTLDVTTGVLTVDRIFKEYDGTETWSESYVANVYLTDYPSGVSNDADANVTYGMCNVYAYANPNVSLETQDNVYLLGHSLNFRDTVHGTSLSDWIDYVTNHHLQVIFPLATPQVIQLTPTQIRMLAGVNTVYASTGDTQVEYFNASVGNLGEVLGDVQEDAQDKIDLASLQTVVAASSDFADFQTRIANL